ncbi:MAG: hypothetical protein Kow0010_22740 [Dehalococcoidia bacterium]
MILVAACALPGSAHDPSPAIQQSDELDPAVYPDPIALLHPIGIIQGCPSAVGLQVAVMSKGEAVDWLRDFSAAAGATRREMADRAYWPLLPQHAADRAQAVEEDRIAVAPATSSPYAELLANACGEEIVDASHWIMTCPARCEPGASDSLAGHYFLVQRQGRWLLWATY